MLPLAPCFPCSSLCVYRLVCAYGKEEVTAPKVRTRNKRTDFTNPNRKPIPISPDLNHNYDGTDTHSVSTTPVLDINLPDEHRAPHAHRDEPDGQVEQQELPASHMDALLAEDLAPEQPGERR